MQVSQNSDNLQASHFIILVLFRLSIGIHFRDHLRIMGFLLLLFTTLFALQFAEARVLQHNSVHLDAVAVASSTPGGHLTNYKGSESNPSSNSVNKIAVELL